MPWAAVKVVLDPAVRDLCQKPYPGHPKGCPNYGKRDICPPRAPWLGDVLDLSQPVYAIWNCFNFAGHVARMREKHPGWSERQLACCLYWQPTARKALAQEIGDFGARSLAKGLTAIFVPEACGVNVTETMRSAGVELEWPPRTVAYQVVVAGTPRPVYTEASSLLERAFPRCGTPNSAVQP